jgi:phenolic acid decarboxylase
MPFGPEDDYIGGDLSDGLLGATVDYVYSKGNHYRLAFDRDHHVTFQFLNAPGRTEDSDFKAPVLACRVREIRAGQYLVHWLVKPASIHVALVIDTVEGRVHVSAMMPPNKWEFFDTATIRSVTYSD